MANPEKVQIPYKLFKDILWTLENIDISNYDETFKEAFNDILDELQAKQKALDIRNIYSQLIAVNKNGSEKQQQEEVKIEYLKKNIFLDNKKTPAYTLV